MNLNGVRVGRLLGISVRVDWSVLAIFGLISWSLATAGYPELAPGYSSSAYWTAGIVTTTLFFFSLLVHELSHSVVARRLGISVRDITLWLFGGVSVIEGEAHSPRDEMKIAVAGPAASFAIAASGLVLAMFLATAGAPELIVACAFWLGWINGLLAVFNLAPAAPLDGGRVLHAWLWHRRGDRTSAGVSAARSGRVFGWVLIALGIVELVTLGAIGGLWLVLLGWFLLAAARAEETQALMVRDFDQVRVRELMTPNPITVTEGVTVDVLLHDYVLGRHCSAFPVVDDGGKLVGLVTMSRIRAVPAARRATTRTRDIAWTLSEVTVADAGDMILDVLRTPCPGGESRILVTSDAALVGILTPTDITRALQISELARAA